MTLINEIESVNWQIGLFGPGEVVEGLADIRQCIGLIIVTSKGSDPLRPEFGTDIYKLVDRPVNVAAPLIVAEILQALQLWERRVRVKKITHRVQVEKLFFTLDLELLANGDSAQILFEIDRIRRTPGDNTLDNRAFGRGFSFAFS